MCVLCVCVCVFVSVENLAIVFYVSLLGLCSICPARVLGLALVRCRFFRGTSSGEGVVIWIHECVAYVRCV